MEPVSPRGVKRKADETHLPPIPKRIKALDPSVVNKIAAGEIIVAPMHALKELIENSVDAGATSIEIMIKDGGLKLLQITDNGHGIDKDDLPILAERFTTSKLKTFEDLTSMTTYGFRGEALASISHIAHLTVTTRTAGSSCAWRAYYRDGKLAAPKPGQSPEPKAIAGRLGTQITVEDLFYNAPQRRRAFKSPSEEYAKILDIVGRYAIHRLGIAFSCKKHGESSTSISISANSGIIDRVKQIHSSQIGNELIEFKTHDDKWKFKAEGWATNANYGVKKMTLLLFINNRLVESSSVKSAIQKIYSAFLPKGSHPWVYLSLDINPKNIDVNVHPTKREVRFLNEDEIIGLVCDTISTELSKVDSSRAFITQSLMLSTKIPSANIAVSKSLPSGQKSGDQVNSQVPRTYENNLVRTDPNSRKITSMLSTTDQSTLLPSSIESNYEIIDCDYRPVEFTSVKQLRAQVRNSKHNQLDEIFATHTFVGIVDLSRQLAAIQSGVNLCLVDYGIISREYFYQVGLTDFQNFGTIQFQNPLDIHELVKIAADAEQQSSGHDLSEAPARITSILVKQRDMLRDHFSMNVSEEGYLETIPLLTKGYLPAMAKIPRFLLRLGPCVKWETELECFDSFLRELADFYSPEQLPNLPPETLSVTQIEENTPMEDAGMENQDDQYLANRRERLSFMVEHVLFPAFKSKLIGTVGLRTAVRQMTDLKSLYRVFERC